MRRATIGATVGLFVMAIGTAGCAWQADLDAQRMQNRKLQEELEGTRTDLADARANLKNIRDRLGMLEQDSAHNKDLADSYRQERDRLMEEYNRAKAALETALAGGMEKPLIIERKLPAALDTALKEFAAKHPDIVEFDSRNGVVKWKSDLLFALGSAVVRESAIESLSAFADVVNSPAAADFDVFIVGHTDSVPIVKPETKEKHPTNWHLSAHRAIAVKDVLAKAKVSEKRMGIGGYSDTRPIVANAGRQGAEKNRRVEIYLVPKGSIGTTAGPEAQRT